MSTPSGSPHARDPAGSTGPHVLNAAGSVEIYRGTHSPSMKLEPTQETLDHGLAEAYGPDAVELVGARGLKPPVPTSLSR